MLITRGSNRPPDKASRRNNVAAIKSRFGALQQTRLG
jgi:hypothetical protein